MKERLSVTKVLAVTWGSLVLAILFAVQASEWMPSGPLRYVACFAVGFAAVWGSREICREMDKRGWLP